MQNKTTDSIDFKLMGEDLFELWREVEPTQYAQTIDDYVTTMYKDRTVKLQSEDTVDYGQVHQTLLGKVLPAYAKYEERRDELLAKKAKRNPWKWAAGFWLTQEIGVALATRGASLFSPIGVLATLAIDIPVGWAGYKLGQTIDDNKIQEEKGKYLKTCSRLNDELQIATDYQKYIETHQDEATFVAIAESYPTGDHFYDDYSRIAEADPVTPQAVAELNAPAFTKFLEPHTLGGATSDLREKRFDALQKAARQYYITRSKENV